MVGAHTKRLLSLIVEGREQHRQESRLERARRRYGKAFAHELGSTFQWRSGPTVLPAWLQTRQEKRRKA